MNSNPHAVGVAKFRLLPRIHLQRGMPECSIHTLEDYASRRRVLCSSVRFTIAHGRLSKLMDPVLTLFGTEQPVLGRIIAQKHGRVIRIDSLARVESVPQLPFHRVVLD